MIHYAVNFHYVGMPEYEYSGIHGLSVEEFRSSLLSISSDCEVVSLRQVLDAASGTRSLPERSCLITFDDGIRCQYEVALPVLDELGIPAVFFVMGGPYLLKKIPLVHKIHWCRANWGNGEILDFIEHQAAERKIPGHPSKVEMEKARKFKPYDDEESSKLKYFLARVLPMETADRIMDRFLEKKKVDLSRLRSDFFMSEEMVRNLGDREMLGSHAVMHVPLSMLSPEELSAELLRSRSYLESLCGRRIEALSYPYGIADSVSRAVADQAAAAGYRVAYTMERAHNTSLDDPCLLARIDCRDIGRMGTFNDRSIFRPGGVDTG